MKQHLLFHLKNDSTIDEALDELHERHFSDSYCIEDVSAQTVRIGTWGSLDAGSCFEHLIFEKIADEDIDWQKQWETFSPCYRDASLHLCLDGQDKNKKQVLLAPGAGFGDFSHPTTRLVFAMMQAHAKERTVIDIGCGSGILSLASIGFGARFAIGLDIDKNALEHAKRNASLNGYSHCTVFSDTVDETHLNDSTHLILMNMISSEQKTAWETYRMLHRRPAILITSGILLSERERYLAYAKEWNWQLIEQREEAGWLAFQFEVSI